MKVTKWNIIYHELVGLQARVISYPDPGVVGFEGLVVEETLKTLVLEGPRRRVRILKANAVLEFQLPEGGEWVVIRGDAIVGRPAERLKRLAR
ncbi:MAG: ribonuclease P protein subunit [Desulfurococcaceae archaeon]